MRYLVSATIRPGADTGAYLAAETARVRELIAEGIAEQSYVRADRTGAYLIINVADLDAAQEVMGTLPLAQAGLLHCTFVELTLPHL